MKGLRILIIMKHKAKFKLIGEHHVKICSKCGKTIKEYRFFTEEEKLAALGELKISAEYCDECEEKLKYKDV